MLFEDLIAAFQNLKGDWFFTCSDSNRKRVEGFKLEEGSSWLDMRRKFCTLRVNKHWLRIPREVVHAPFLEAFEARLDVALGSLILWVPCRCTVSQGNCWKVLIYCCEDWVHIKHIIGFCCSLNGWQQPFFVHFCSILCAVIAETLSLSVSCFSVAVLAEISHSFPWVICFCDGLQEAYL